MTYIDGMDDPAKMWKVFADRYNPKSQATLLQLVREFMTAKKDDSIDMEHRLQRVQRLKRQVEEQEKERRSLTPSITASFSTVSLTITRLLSVSLNLRRS